MILDIRETRSKVGPSEMWRSWKKPVKDGSAPQRWWDDSCGGVYVVNLDRSATGNTSSLCTKARFQAFWPNTFVLSGFTYINVYVCLYFARLFVFFTSEFTICEPFVHPCTCALPRSAADCLHGSPAEERRCYDQSQKRSQERLITLREAGWSTGEDGQDWGFLDHFWEGTFLPSGVNPTGPGAWLGLTQVIVASAPQEVKPKKRIERSEQWRRKANSVWKVGGLTVVWEIQRSRHGLWNVQLSLWIRPPQLSAPNSSNDFVVLVLSIKPSFLLPPSLPGSFAPDFVFLSCCLIDESFFGIRIGAGLSA